MIDDFFDENEPPPWAMQEARSRLRLAGEAAPDERLLRHQAWRILQSLERDAGRRSLP